VIRPLQISEDLKPAGCKALQSGGLPVKICEELKEKSCFLVQTGIGLVLEAVRCVDLSRSYNPTDSGAERRAGDQVGATASFF
jgi:hypothetical protein